jgi:hypothetical protein
MFVQCLAQVLLNDRVLAVMRHGRLLPLSLLALAVSAAPAAAAPLGAVARDSEPVVLKGSAFGTWSVPANVTAKAPLTDLACHSPQDPTSGDDCPHNGYVKPEVDTASAQPSGTPVDKLLGYRWDAKHGRYEQVPFQVDEVFTRYLDNSASGFAFYSGNDQHTTYAYNREGFRYVKDGPATDPCRAQPDSPAMKDPIAGLDSNDEAAFMASDAGPQAPSGAALPKGIDAAQEVAVTDPTQPDAAPRYLYVMKAGDKGPRPAFTAANGYVRYQRDANADLFAYSQSSYGNYGNTYKGIYCDDQGNVVLGADGKPKIGQRRPRDGAWITTPRYRYRYDGRWLMTQIQIRRKDDKGYGPDLVDRWKARAFAQDPSSKTPCCGYEEEDTNWGGSSILLGERTGPVRAVRETWGADSGTNVIRRETFYRDSMSQRNWLRVHVIPPLDGIYAQWDFNAGRVTRFYNSKNPAGVPIDGHNDEVFGNFDDPCNPTYDGNDTSSTDQQYRQLYKQLGGCSATQYHLSMDPGDPTFTDANAALGWSETAGPNGTIVDRIQAVPENATPGGTAQSVAAFPYYRDDACFDDGTGSDPGPELYPRHPDQEAKSTAPDGSPRRCWRPDKGDPAVPNGDQRFWQGDIGTHGLHLMFLADSDNARQTVPTDEIVSDWNMVMLPGDPGNVGEQYGRAFERPLVTVVRPVTG